MHLNLEWLFFETKPANHDSEAINFDVKNMLLSDEELELELNWNLVHASYVGNLN